MQPKLLLLLFLLACDTSALTKPTPMVAAKDQVVPQAEYQLVCIEGFTYAIVRGPFAGYMVPVFTFVQVLGYGVPTPCPVKVEP